MVAGNIPIRNEPAGAKVIDDFKTRQNTETAGFFASYIGVIAL